MHVSIVNHFDAGYHEKTHNDGHVFVSRRIARQVDNMTMFEFPNDGRPKAIDDTEWNDFGNDTVVGYNECKQEETERDSWIR